MPLKDMAYTEAEIKEEVKEMKEGGDMPRYPYGLCLSLNDDILEKLGISMMPSVGSQVAIQAMATVTTTSARQEADGENCVHVELQITAMDLTMPLATGKAAQKLYGKDDD